MAAFRHWRGGAKIIAVSAAAMSLSFGLCATGSGHTDGFGRIIWGMQIRVGMVLCMLSALGVLVGLIALAAGLFED